MEYRQIRTISGRGEKPEQFKEALRAITVDGSDRIFAVGDSEVKVFDSSGVLDTGFRTNRPGHSIGIAPDGTVHVGQAGQLEIFDAQGRTLGIWRDEEKLGLVTAIDFLAGQVLVADASDRCIRRYDQEGKFLGNIGKDNRMKGFLIPNGVLDFSVDDQGIIYAANPGKHRIERYTLDGELLGHIGRFDGRDPEGFPGCCNPTNLLVIGRDRIYVTEKAAPRVKVYNREGKLLAVIATTEAFDPNCKNMDLAVDSAGNVLVADTVRLQICVFAPE